MKFEGIPKFQIDINHIESFGRMILTLTLLEDFILAKSETKNNIDKYLNNINPARRIIDYISKENRCVFKSWEFIYEQNINNLISLAYNLSKQINNCDFLIDVIHCITEKSKFSNIEITSTNMNHLAVAIGGFDKKSTQGRPQKDIFKTNYSIARPAVIAGVLVAGKGHIQYHEKNCFIKVKTSEDVYSATAKICGVGKDVIRKNCFENKNSNGAILRKVVTEHASILFKELKSDKMVTLPSVYEVFMVMFRLVTLHESNMWTGKISETGIPELEYL